MFFAQNSHTKVTQIWAGEAGDGHTQIMTFLLPLKIYTFISVLSPEIQLHGRSSHLWGKSGPSVLQVWVSSVLSCSLGPYNRSRPLFLNIWSNISDISDQRLSPPPVSWRPVRCSGWSDVLRRGSSQEHVSALFIHKHPVLFHLCRILGQIMGFLPYKRRIKQISLFVMRTMTKEQWPK